ncbi:MAG: DUF262 domain-containing protein [Giesbergeria sp.]|nr:DUF262 domain-containing protein [Giesbergeria sp.]
MAFFSAEHKNIRTVPLKQWLHWAAGHAPHELQVALPLIQRGFVWKPNQIIELWDTLLQDMPIGALLVSEMAADAHGIAPDAERKRTTAALPGSQRLALVDGQQRTLAMLIGWPLLADAPSAHRLWVDFADTPRSGERLRLRITTRNQPFGFQRDNANSKLSQAQRRAAKEAWLQTPAGAGQDPNALPSFDHTRPYHHQSTLALDMRDLVQWWQDKNGDAAAWSQQVLAALEALQTPAPIPQDSAIHQRIATLATGLAHLHAADIALLRVASELFDTTATRTDATDATDATDPPLALLFKRLGSNATPLSNDDYVYAILKHLQPEVHDLVNGLHGQQKEQRASVASLLSATDLAMSALRLAAAHHNSEQPDSASVPDPESPDKQAFHRLIRHKGFLENSFLPLLQNSDLLPQWFDRVLACLDYRKQDEHDAGLPRHALPHLSRPLVQVLLRLAQIGYLGTATSPISTERRGDVLRLVLYWWLCVHNEHKASRLAYQVIAEMQSTPTVLNAHELGQRIAQHLTEKNVGRALPTPEAIQNCPGLLPALLPGQDRQGYVPGWARFDPTQHGDTGAALRHFWEHWCAHWSHRHPLLLWLQRSYVAEQLHGDPVAGRDEDTPYDYDHILPSSHWAEWRGAAQNNLRLIDHCDDIHLIGNSIGNVRVWSSSDNRSDGDTAPAYKLALVPEHGATEDDTAQATRLNKSAQILRDSAIAEAQTALWQAHVPECNTRAAHREWTLQRSWQWEDVVSQRALALYQQFYQDAGFSASFTTPQAVQALEATKNQ